MADRRHFERLGFAERGILVIGEAGGSNRVDSRSHERSTTLLFGRRRSTSQIPRHAMEACGRRSGDAPDDLPVGPKGRTATPKGYLVQHSPNDDKYISIKSWWNNQGNIAQKNLEDDIFNPAKKKQAVRLAVFRPHFKKMDGGR